MNVRRWTIWITLLLAAAMAAGCAGSAAGTPAPGGAGGGEPSAEAATPAAPGGSNSASKDMLANTAWQLTAMGAPGTTLPELPGATITLEFDGQGRASGNSGCNSYGGGYRLDGERITFTEMMSTLMACADNGVNQLETTYMQALSAAQTFSLAGDSLTIRYGDGMELNFAHR